jgi:hypothetical protein
MAEIGFVKFATMALQVGQAALPAYRSQFSKRQYTPPQLLAILCLMRYEDWTFREAEVRLAEHAELCTALGLRYVPDDTTFSAPLPPPRRRRFPPTMSAPFPVRLRHPSRHTRNCNSPHLLDDPPAMPYD